MKMVEPELRSIMAAAVKECLIHVEAGGLPFVGVLVDGTAVISEFGVNQVLETGDPSAHAEIVAMRNALATHGIDTLAGTTLLATGEPCGLCYRFAIDHGVAAIYTALDRDVVADHGFDYRSSYLPLGISDDRRAELLHQLPVAGGLEPFHRYRHTRPSRGPRMGTPRALVKGPSQ